MLVPLYVCSVCACLVLSASSSCLGWAAAYGCGIPWTLILFFLNLPFILQVGLALLHVLSDLHVRVIDAEIVYPLLQLNVATD